MRKFFRLRKPVSHSLLFFMVFSVSFLGSFLGGENSSWAQFKVFAIPQTSAPLSSREKILHHPLVLKAEPLFDSSERLWLKQSGESILPEVLELTLSREAAAGDLRDWVVAERIGYLIEDRWAATAASSNSVAAERGVSFAQDQWALNNRGEAQSYALSGLRDLWIAGQKGEDIMGVLPIPEERLDLPPALVAVMDTGVDTGHPGLKMKIRRKESECKIRDEFLACQVEARKIPVSKAPERKKALDACDQRFDGPEGDTDKNHYPMDCEGWNTTGGVRKTSGVRGSSDVQDTRGHGTFVAGIVAAAWGKHGIRGATQLAQILPIKVFNNSVLGPARPQGVEGNANSNIDSNTGLDSPVESVSRWPDQAFADVMARGILYALREGARVINLSLHWPPFADSELMRRLVALAERRGVLIDQ